MFGTKLQKPPLTTAVSLFLAQSALVILDVWKLWHCQAVFLVPLGCGPSLRGADLTAHLMEAFITQLSSSSSRHQNQS